MFTLMLVWKFFMMAKLDQMRHLASKSKNKDTKYKFLQEKKYKQKNDTQS